MTDAYNAELLHLYQQYKNNNNKTPLYFVDNRDLNDPLWDSARDWIHACRNVYRPMAQRLLEMMLRRIEKE